MALIQAIIKWLSDNMAAVAVVLFNIEEKRVNEAKSKQQTAELNLELEKNKETVINKHLNESDADVIREVTGSELKPGKPKKDS